MKNEENNNKQKPYTKSFLRPRYLNCLVALITDTENFE